MKAFTVSSADVAKCPTHRLDVDHYWSDGFGGCKCRRLTEDDFDARFKPLCFTMESGPGAVEADEGIQWVEFDVAERYPPERVWSVMDADDGGESYSPGFHVVTVFAYIITAEPWTDEIDEAMVDKADDPEDEDGAPCCPDPDCPGRGGDPAKCTFPGYADNH